MNRRHTRNHHPYATLPARNRPHTVGTVSFARSLPSTAVIASVSASPATGTRPHTPRSSSATPPLSFPSAAHEALSRQLELRVKTISSIQSDQNQLPQSPPSSAISSSPRSQINLEDFEQLPSEDTSKHLLARALYDFVGNHEQLELIVGSDDILLVDESSMVDGWYWARVVDRQYTSDQGKTAYDNCESENATPVSETPADTSGEDGHWGWVPATYIRWLGTRSLSSMWEAEIVNSGNPEANLNPVIMADSLASHTIAIGWGDVLKRADVGWSDDSRPFALSGAQNFILEPNEDQSGASTRFNAYRIVDGPSWYNAVANFTKIRINSRHLRRNWLKTWVVYEIECIGYLGQTESIPRSSSVVTTVRRRYSQFCMLAEYLQKFFPAILIPGLPVGSWGYSLDNQSLDARQRALERWINRIAFHPVLGSSDGFLLFTCTDSSIDSADVDGATALSESFRKIGFSNSSQWWSRAIGAFSSADSTHRHSVLSHAEDGCEARHANQENGIGNFYKAVRHPEFNLVADDPAIAMADLRKTWKMSAPVWFDVPDIITGDFEGASAAIRFAKQTAVDARNLKVLLSDYQGIMQNDNRRELKRIAYALQRMLRHSQFKHQTGNDDLINVADSKPDSTSPSIWCHRGRGYCDKCTSLTVSIQSFASALGKMANVSTDFSQETIQPLLERLEELAHDIDMRSTFLQQIHEDGANLGKSLAATLRRGQSAANSDQINQQKSSASCDVGVDDSTSGEYIPPFDKDLSPAHVFSRLETVFNVNHAELAHWFHDERHKEWSEILTELLEGEIIRAEKCLQLLRGCRTAFNRLR